MPGSNILGQVMSSALGYGQTAMRTAAAGKQSEPKQKDPNAVLLEKYYTEAVKSGDPEAIERVRKSAENYGYDTDMLAAMAGKTEDWERRQKIKSGVGDFVLNILGLNEASPDLMQHIPTAQETSEQMSLAETPAPNIPVSGTLTMPDGVARSLMGIPEGMNINLDPDTGDSSVSLSAPPKSDYRKFKQNLDEMQADGILTPNEYQAALGWGKDKMIGKRFKSMERVVSTIEGTTTLKAIAEDGEILSEKKYKTDLDAETLRRQRIEEKLTGVKTSVSDITGETIVEPFVGGELQEPQTGAKVKVPESEKITAGTKAKLEQIVTEGAKNLDRLEQISKDFQKSFVTTGGKVLAGTGKVIGRLTGAEIAPEFRKDFEGFKETVRVNTLLWRKFITGVAGGAKEFKAIEKAILNIDTDDAVAFQAKLEQMQNLTAGAMLRAQELRKNFGVDIASLNDEQRMELLEKFPLDAYVDQAEGVLQERNKQSKPSVLKFDAEGNQINE